MRIIPELWSLDLLLTNMWSISVDEVGEIRVGFVIVGSKPNESKFSRYSLVIRPGVAGADLQTAL